MEDLLQVGAITQPHGVHGEVKVFPTTDDPKRFKKLKEIILDTGKEKKVLEIESVRFFKQFVILKFKGMDTMNDVEIYKHRNLYVTRENAVKCAKDEYFIVDLIGCRVVDENDRALGILQDVIQTGANDVYEVKLAEGGEVLIPAIKECILSVDIEKREIRVHLLEGLLDETIRA
ncbi:MAG: 16S rRNA processing protein RimM [Lachnospiraceae bacterium]|jgi:16S rRNA processing protein RimM|nr:16S rRNA processing protein RimM [Lachnospiraceae bacterium]